ncbi:MAG: hypothetical protein WBW32_07240, partial [Luteibacter sp.]
LSGIGERVGALSTMVADVMAATQGQTSGIERVNGAIVVIDETTRENAALVEQAASASRAMRESAESLRREVAYFTLEAA